MVPKDYAQAIDERSRYVGYDFCVVFLKPHLPNSEIVENFKQYLHENNGHVPPDKVFEASGWYLAVVEGSSNSFRLARNLPRNIETRSVDGLVEDFLLSEARSGRPLEVSVGIAEYNKNADVVHQLAMLAQRRWFVEDGALVSRNEMARYALPVKDGFFSQVG